MFLHSTVHYPMRNLCSILLLALATPTYGEIVFDWKYTPIPIEKQKIIEARTKAAAAKYLESKYTAFNVEIVMKWSDIPIDEDEQQDIENRIKTAAEAYLRKDTKAFTEELHFDWGNSSISTDVILQKLLEERASAAAIKWAEKRYPNYGPYNFLTAKEIYTITVDDIPQHAELWGGRHILLDQSLVNDPALLQIVVFHELRHAYDFYVADNLLRLEVDKAKNRKERLEIIKRAADEFNETAHNIRFSSERRARQMTKMYTMELHADHGTKLEHFREGGEVENE